MASASPTFPPASELIKWKRVPFCFMRTSSEAWKRPENPDALFLAPFPSHGLKTGQRQQLRSRWLPCKNLPVSMAVSVLSTSQQADNWGWTRRGTRTLCWQNYPPIKENRKLSLDSNSILKIKVTTIYWHFATEQAQCAKRSRSICSSQHQPNRGTC